MTREEAAFYSSAEEYWKRAGDLRASITAMMDNEERATLLASAAELEQLAAMLEDMRIRCPTSGLIGLTRRGRRAFA
jgi:multidrug resistance efflux pump